LTSRLKPLLVEKYDISQKILKEFADLESRHILFSIITEPKSTQEISSELKIPLSSVYKKIECLKECSLISERVDFALDGRKTTFYQSKISNVEINISKFEPVISFCRNKDMRYE
jgi:predicted transcriptional regulator